MTDKNGLLDDAELDGVSGGTGTLRGSGPTGVIGRLHGLNLTAAGSAVSASGMKCPCGGTFVPDAAAGKYVCDRCGDVLTANAEK